MKQLPLAHLFPARKTASVLFVFFTLFLSALTVSAQESPAGRGGLESSVAEMTEARDSLGSYIINPLDRLVIVIYAGERRIDEIDDHVKSDGTVYLPFLERDVAIGGMRILDAEDELEKLSRASIRDPRIVITLMSSYSQTVSTYGKITNVDVEMKSPIRVLQLIAKAGGPDEDAKTDSIRVISVDGTVRFFDYERVNRRPSTIENFYLKPGDIVFVPGIDDFSVMVLGNATTPGRYYLEEGDKLLDALVRAGSWGVDADVKNVRLLRVRVGRRVEVFKINLEEIFDKGKVSMNYRLEDGDIIYIPAETTQRFITIFYTVLMSISTTMSIFLIIDTLRD